MTGGKFFDDTLGAIGGTVVHHDDLAFQATRQRSGERAAQERRDVFFFIEERNQNR
jgi:hypothetical protein